MDTSSTAQFYRAGMYEQMKHMSSMHGKTKRGKRVTGITHHGYRGMHGEGKYPDAFRNKGAGRASGAPRGGKA